MLEEPKVNGPVYQRIVQGKDLSADVLPPPEYIIESYLVTLQMERMEDKAELAALIGKTEHGKFQARKPACTFGCGVGEEGWRSGRERC